MDRSALGWNPFFQQHFESLDDPALAPARVARQDRQLCLVYTDAGELTARLAGRLRHEAASPADLPAVGDWVAVEPRPAEGAATIRAVLPRTSCFLRKAAGSHADEQVVAANVDSVFLVSGLDGDFSPRRIERYLTVAWDSGAAPVVVLNKADLCGDVAAPVAEAEAVALGVPVLAVSAAERRGLDALAPYLAVGHTVAFLGSSGVGKSTLINALLDAERQAVRAVRADDSRGRHTTTHRELIPLPGGALLMDTPGLRELGLWGDETSLSASFADVEELAARCRFRDCAHRGEPGCAVQQALAEGELAVERWQSYLKLQRELRHLERRRDHKARLAERAKWRKIAIACRKYKKRW